MSFCQVFLSASKDQSARARTHTHYHPDGDSGQMMVTSSSESADGYSLRVLLSCAGAFRPKHLSRRSQCCLSCSVSTLLTAAQLDIFCGVHNYKMESVTHPFVMPLSGVDSI